MSPELRNHLIFLHNKWVDDFHEHRAKAEAAAAAGASSQVRAFLCADHANELRDLLGKLSDAELHDGPITEEMIQDELQEIKKLIMDKYSGMYLREETRGKIEEYLYSERENLRREATQRIKDRILKQLKPKPEP